MAALLITQAALDHIRDAVCRQRMERPLVTALWSIGQAEVTRGPDGKVSWERSPSEWRVTLIDLVAFEREVKEAMPTEDVVLPSANAMISGIAFYLYGRPGNRMLDDCELTLDGEELRVLEKNAIR
jgi:hypothetical protein